jgi:hypothetical protein
VFRAADARSLVAPVTRRSVAPGPPLIPPDMKQCQAEKPNGQSFMTLGGGHKMVRCTAAPMWIATERKAGHDGRKGSMSLCDDCGAVMKEQLGPAACTFREIRRKS